MDGTGGKLNAPQLIFLTAGRKYVHVTLSAWLTRFPDLAKTAIVVDDSGDSGDADRRAWLTAEFGVSSRPASP